MITRARQRRMLATKTCVCFGRTVGAARNRSVPHLRRDRDSRAVENMGMPQHQPPEQVLLSFDENYDIVEAQPIRGDGWSGTPQKNWVPFDH